MRAEWLLYGMRGLIRRRRRLYPTLLSISIGMMLVVIVSTVGEIGSGLVEEEIQSLGVGSVTITANKTVAMFFNDPISTLYLGIFQWHFFYWKQIIMKGIFER